MINLHACPFATAYWWSWGSANAIRASLKPPIEVVTNPDWDQTHMSDSLQLALERLCVGLDFVTPVDVPPRRPSWLERSNLLAPRGPDPYGTTRSSRVGTDWPDPSSAPSWNIGSSTSIGTKGQVPDIECTLNLNAPPDWKKWLETFTMIDKNATIDQLVHRSIYTALLSFDGHRYGPSKLLSVATIATNPAAANAPATAASSVTAEVQPRSHNRRSRAKACSVSPFNATTVPI